MLHKSLLVQTKDSINLLHEVTVTHYFDIFAKFFLKFLFQWLELKSHTTQMQQIYTLKKTTVIVRWSGSFTGWAIATVRARLHVRCAPLLLSLLLTASDGDWHHHTCMYCKLAWNHLLTHLVKVEFLTTHFVLHTLYANMSIVQWMHQSSQLAVVMDGWWKCLHNCLTYCNSPSKHQHGTLSLRLTDAFNCHHGGSLSCLYKLQQSKIYM